MAAPLEGFTEWLTDRLLQLNPEADTDVFVSYITGILEEDVPKDERRESLVDLIGQVVEDDMGAVCDELFKKWEEMNGVSGNDSSKDCGTEKLTDHLANILEQQKIEAVKPKEKSAEEIARKQAILDHYEQVSSGEEDNEGGPDDSKGQKAGQGDSLIELKNVNAESVKKIEQEKREKAKQEAEKKREKDKQDREAQKQKQKERKETEKKRTQKGERKR